MTKRRFVLAAGLWLMCAAAAGAQDPFRFAGTPCVTPPRLHCPDTDCPSDRVINEGYVVEIEDVGPAVHASPRPSTPTI